MMSIRNVLCLLGLLALWSAPGAFGGATELGEEVSSPDVPMNSTCAADIVMHCKHLLAKDADVAGKKKANLSKSIVAASKLGHGEHKKGGKAGKAGKRPKKRTKKGRKPATATGSGAGTGVVGSFSGSNSTAVGASQAGAAAGAGSAGGGGAGSLGALGSSTAVAEAAQAAAGGTNGTALTNGTAATQVPGAARAAGTTREAIQAAGATKAADTAAKTAQGAGTGVGTAQAAGSNAGTAGAAGSAAGTAQAAGSGAGTAQVAGTGAGTAQVAGTAAEMSRALAAAVGTARAAGTAAGMGQAAGTAAGVGQAAGTAAGTGQAAGTAGMTQAAGAAHAADTTTTRAADTANAAANATTGAAGTTQAAMSTKAADVAQTAGAAQTAGTAPAAAAAAGAAAAAANASAPAPAANGTAATASAASKAAVAAGGGAAGSSAAHEATDKPTAMGGTLAANASGAAEASSFQHAAGANYQQQQHVQARRRHLLAAEVGNTTAAGAGAAEAAGAGAGAGGSVGTGAGTGAAAAAVVGDAGAAAAGGAAAGTTTAGGGAAAAGGAAAGTTAATTSAAAGGVAEAVAEVAAVGAKSVLAELNAAESQQDDLSRALAMLGLRANTSAGAMAIASAPIARCLRSVMHANEMSINPNIPSVADECKAEVRSVLIRRSSDVRYDPPLLASCAHDIVTHCEEVGRDSTAVLGCLKAVKLQLLPGCRNVVTARQAAAAEDLSLDPDLQRDCGEERDELCLEAGWGNGAAQACLLGHLRGSMPLVFSETIFPSAAFRALSGGAAAAIAAGGMAAPTVELSARCSAALVRRLMEEGEDVRLNYRLSAACAGDKQVLCRDVRPGGAAVLRCLEDHLGNPDMREECKDALLESRQLRSLDVRLDHTFSEGCAADVRSLCTEEAAESMLGGPEDVAFGLTEPFECLRGRLDLVREPTCRRHMYESLIAAYNDNRLDAGLMRGCHAEVAMHCPAHPARALQCLQEKIDQFSLEDSPAVLRGKISEGCMRVALDRRLQAATDVAFVPDLMQACSREHAALCSEPGMEGMRALDCLADHRSSPDFSAHCSDALRDYLASAAADIRTMAGLQADCSGEILQLCKGVQPGDGRVIGCLRDHRSNITGELCRRQVLRLLGFMVEDHRLDVRLTQACTSDVQKYCAGVPVGDGQVHDCLRRSVDHLSPECRFAEEEVEALEHEDVRLNPKLMRECPLAVSTFCPEVPPGDARVISCLQTHMDRGHFPPACRAVLVALTDRASTKYSLNVRLRNECDDDAQRLCADASDEAGSRHSLTGTGVGSSRIREAKLGCLARQPAALLPECRAELQSLVKLSLNRYRVGMPLTSQCDGDVMQRCQVDQMAAPFLQTGYVLGCLAKHAAKLHKPCWELVSTMDEGQFKRAAAAETTAWQTQSGGVLDEGVLQRVAADVRRELEPRLYSSVHEQIKHNAHAAARNATVELEARLTTKLAVAVARAWGSHVGSLAPRVNALLHTTYSLLLLTAVGLLGAALVARRYLAPGGGLLVVRKDGRV